MKKFILKFISLSLILISWYWIFTYQNNFSRNEEVKKSKDILEYSLWNFNFISTKLISIFSEPLKYTVDTQLLAINIDNSVTYWKNKWLSEEKNRNYITDYLLFYRDYWISYSVLYDKILSDTNLINEENTKFYNDLLQNNVKNKIEENFEQEKWYYSLKNDIMTKYCKDFSEYKVWSWFDDYYKKLSLREYNNKNYLWAFCFNLLSWYKTELSWWQTLFFWYFSHYINELVEKTEDKAEKRKILEKALEDINLYRNYLIEYIEYKRENKNEYRQYFHRYSNDIYEVRWLNNAYSLFINKIYHSFYLIDLEENKKTNWES